jgi:hypothetical protein
MADTNYRTVRRGDDTFEVEILRSGALRETAAGFASEAEAIEWIAQDKRLSNEADPVRTAAARKWRGF